MARASNTANTIVRIKISRPRCSQPFPHTTPTCSSIVAGCPMQDNLNVIRRIQMRIPTTQRTLRPGAPATRRPNNPPTPPQPNPNRSYPQHPQGLKARPNELHTITNRRHESQPNRSSQAPTVRPIPAWGNAPGKGTSQAPSTLPKAGVKPQAKRPNCLPRRPPPLQTTATRSPSPSAHHSQRQRRAPSQPGATPQVKAQAKPLPLCRRPE
jgi:hypothetical protein